MATKQRSQEQRPVAAKADPVLIVLVGSACMLVGLGVGYYFGQQNAAMSAAGPPPAPVQGTATGSLMNPAEFAQQEAGLKAAVAAAPKNLDSLIRLGNLYYDNQKWSAAVDYYGRALEIDPRNVNVRTDRGTAYWNENQPDAAIAEFKKSLEVEPSHAQTLYNLGVVYLHGKNDPEATRRAWQRLLATNPNYPDRAKIEQQLAALSAPSTPPPSQPAENPAGVEDLLRRMKK
jgi:cytochrome c-type biogenesis protein CcmH/NrfG